MTRMRSSQGRIVARVKAFRAEMPVSPGMLAECPRNVPCSPVVPASNPAPPHVPLFAILSTKERIAPQRLEIELDKIGDLLYNSSLPYCAP